MLVKRRVDIDKRSKKSSRTPLHIACDRGNIEIVRILLDGRASVQRSHRGRRAIDFAATAGHAAVVRLLIERGARFHDLLDNKQTLSPEVVKVLEHAGAIAFARLLYQNADWWWQMLKNSGSRQRLLATSRLRRIFLTSAKALGIFPVRHGEKKTNS